MGKVHNLVSDLNAARNKHLYNFWGFFPCGSGGGEGEDEERCLLVRSVPSPFKSAFSPEMVLHASRWAAAPALARTCVLGFLLSCHRLSFSPGSRLQLHKASKNRNETPPPTRASIFHADIFPCFEAEATAFPLVLFLKKEKENNFLGRCKWRPTDTPSL